MTIKKNVTLIKNCIENWNNSTSHSSKRKTICDVFAEKAKILPDKKAVIDNGKSISYKELNEKTDILAKYIVYLLSENKSILEETSIIVICIERSINFIISVLGVLKSGAAYVPVDPNYPDKRKQMILEETKSKILITQKEIAESDTFKQVNSLIILDIDDFFLNLKTHVNSDNISLNRFHYDNLAYIIFTSGTTGRPKGVCMKHKDLFFMIYEYIHNIGATAEDVFALTMSIAFTGSIPSIFSPLMLGSTLIIERMDILVSPRNFVESIKNNNITILKFTPSMFNLIIEEFEGLLLKKLKIILSGEPLLKQDCIRYLNKNWKIFNQYGFSECVSGFSIQLVDKKLFNKLSTNVIPIGIPYRGRKIFPPKRYTSNLEFELIVGGRGLACGYLNNPELTNEKFFEDKNHSYYKTGDIVKVNSCGYLEIIGRTDTQIKLRGIRVETLEISNLAISFPGVKEAFTKGVLNKEKNKFNGLALYYTVKNNFKGIDTAKLNDFLKDRLPVQLVPNYLIRLDNLPLNIHGKVDHNALPEPTINQNTKKYLSPKNEIEKKLVQIWSEVLKIEKIGVLDNFLSLGGNSISAIMILQKMNNLNIQISVRDFLNSENIKTIALNSVLAKDVHTEDYINVLNLPLSFVEDYYFKWADGSSHLFNTVFSFTCYKHIDTEKFYNAADYVLSQLDVIKFKYKYSVVNRQWERNLSKLEKDYLVVCEKNESFSSEQIKDKINYFLYEKISIIDKFSMILYAVNFDGTFHLFIISHHLYIDQISSRIIKDSIFNFYEFNNDVILPKLTTWMQVKNKVNIYEYKNVLKKYFMIKNQPNCFYPDIESSCDNYCDYYTINKSIQLTQGANDLVIILFKSLFLALHNWKKTRHISVDFVNNGRVSYLNFAMPSLPYTVGWMAVNMPVYIEVSENIMENISKIITTDNALLYSIAKEKKVKNLVEKSPFLFNCFIGDLNTNKRPSLTTLQKIIETTHYEKSDYKIIFKAILMNKKIKLSITYNTNNYFEKTAKKILKIWKAEVKNELESGYVNEGN